MMVAKDHFYDERLRCLLYSYADVGTISLKKS